MTQTMYQQPPATTNTPVLPEYVITEADKKRVKAIHEAWKAYHGDLDKPLQRMPGQPDDNVMSNRIQPIVDSGGDFLFGKEFEISVSGPKEAQVFLNKTWGRKEARIPLLLRWEMNGANAGAAFLRIVPGRKQGVFRIVNVDPATVFVQTAPQDCDTITLYCIQYACNEKRNGKDVQVFYREEIKRIDPSDDDDDDDEEEYEDSDADGIDDDVTWLCQHWTQIGASGQEPKQASWQVAGDPIPWNYPFPPIFMNQNLPLPNDPWGMPDTTYDLIGMNNALNLTQSSANRVLKMYGQPILWATGVAESRLDVTPGKIIGLDDVNGKIESVAITSDTPTALNFANNIRSDMDEQSKVPAVATGRMETLPKGNLPGITIELMFMPLLKKTDKKRCLYGEVIIELSKALLILNNMSRDIEITLQWQNPLPNDTLPQAQAAVLKKQFGVSNRTLLEEAGYDPVEEMARNQEEDQAKMIAFTRGQGMPPASPNMPGMMQPGQQQQGQESPFMNRGQ